jgi:hypothetical protein
MSTIKGEDTRAQLRKIFQKDLKDLTDRRKRAKEELKSFVKGSTEWVELKIKITTLGKRIIKTKKLVEAHAKPIQKESIYAKR